MRRTMQRQNLSLKVIRSELEFHSAQALLKEGKLDEARRKMSLAYAKSSRNIDILIRMYQTEGDDRWRG